MSREATAPKLVRLNESDKKIAPPKRWLEITSGRTSYPLRPLFGERFLIGAGSHCDVQLGDDEIPLVHTILKTDGQIVTCEALVAEPRLIVNREPCRSAELHDCDVVSIGRFSFRFRCSPSDAYRSAVPEESTDDYLLEESSPPRNYQQMSALELVDLLESDLRLVDEYEAGIEAGAATLLRAISERDET